MVDAGIRVAFVTHLHDLAHRLYENRSSGSLFLRAERTDDGARTFRLHPGEPRETSYGEDLYEQVFGVQPTPRRQPA